VTFANYVDDFLAYDSHHNKVKNRTSKEGFIVHFAPMVNDCSKYERYTEEWKKCVCWQKLGDENAARIAAMYRNGVPIARIMEFFGLSSPECIYIVVREYGIGPKRRYKARGRLSREELEKIKQMYLEGKSIYAIAKELGRPPSTIYYALKRMGLR